MTPRDEPGAPGHAAAPETVSLQRSTRDSEAVAASLETWLRHRLGTTPDPRVVSVAGTSANGMSSETLLFDAEWSDDAGRAVHHLVARVAPDPADVPVFPSYDLGRQFEIMRLVADRTEVPVPATHWFEPEPDALGAPFFVMSRVNGEVPPDVMPYNFGDSWLFAASAADQRRLQDSTVAAIAALHTLPLDDEITALAGFSTEGATPLRRHLAHTRAWYEWAVAGGPRSALVDEGLTWLEQHLPDDEGETVLSWGDARIGNVIYDHFEPAAILDWEMVGIGPRELDVAWLIFAHSVFEQIAAQFELSGMPDFLRAEDVVDTYHRLTGYEPRHLDWHLTYAAVQFGIVFLRTGQRQIHFGETERPESIDDLMHHKGLLAARLGH